MRVREKSTMSTSIDLSGHHNPSCAGTVDWTPWSSGLMTGEYYYMEDLPTPGFRRRSQSGEIIITPMKSIHESRSITPGSFTRIASKLYDCTPPTGVKDTDYVQQIYGSIGPYYARNFLNPSYLISASDITDLTNVVATSCYANSAEHEAGILEDIAQMSRTVEMLQDPLLRAHHWADDVAKKIRNSRVRGIVRAAGRLPDYWLQYRYGIAPMIGTIDAILKEMPKDRIERNVTSRASGSLSASNTITSSSSDSAGVYSLRATDTDNVVIRAGIIRRQYLSLANVLGVDTAGAVALPWQLMPYSFIADWFLNVEDYLQAMPAYLKHDSLGSWVSITRTLTRDVECVGYTPASPYTSTSPPGGRHTLVRKEKSRTPGLPAPQVSFRPKALEKLILEPNKRTIDSLALLSNKLNDLFGPGAHRARLYR